MVCYDLLQIKDWAAIAGVVVAVGVIAAGIWTRIRDHQRSRRQLVIDLMQFWHSADSLNNTRKIRSIIFAADEVACEAIEAGRSFQTSPAFAKLVHEALEDDAPGDHIPSEAYPNAITQGQSAILRALIVHQANLLEIVAAAYVNRVCDVQMLEQEFRYVFYRSEQFVFGSYIDATHRYPSLKRLRIEFDEARLRAIKTRRKIW